MESLSSYQKVKIRVLGRAGIGKRKKTGWSGSLRFYAFKCPVHGYVENYAQTHYKILKCPKCG